MLNDGHASEPWITLGEALCIRGIYCTLESTQSRLGRGGVNKPFSRITLTYLIILLRWDDVLESACTLVTVIHQLWQEVPLRRGTLST